MVCLVSSSDRLQRSKLIRNTSKPSRHLNDPFIKSSFSDYTEQDFAKFIDEIRKEDKAPTDERADVLVRHFNEVVGHPSGMDLIYYPERGADTSSAGITRTVATWRAANGLPGFKR